MVSVLHSIQGRGRVLTRKFWGMKAVHFRSKINMWFSMFYEDLTQKLVSYDRVWLQHETNKNVATPSCIACNLQVPIYTPGWREALWEWSVLRKNTTQCARPGLEPGPLDPETSALTMRPPRLSRVIWSKDKMTSIFNVESCALLMQTVPATIPAYFLSLQHAALSLLHFPAPWPLVCAHL